MPRYNDTMYTLSKTACEVRQSVTLLCTILCLRSRCVWTRSSRYVVSCRVASRRLCCVVLYFVVLCCVVLCSEQAVTNGEVRWKLSRHLRLLTADSQADTRGTDRSLYDADTDRSLNDAGLITASSLLQCRSMNTLYSWYTDKHKSLHLSSARRFSSHHQHVTLITFSSFSNTR